MGFLSRLFGSSKDSKDSTSSLPDKEALEEAAAAEEARRAFNEQQAQQVVRDHERGLYTSWEDAKRKNPQLTDMELEDAANLHWQHPHQKDTFDESMHRRPWE